MMKIDTTAARNGETAIRIWASSNSESTPQGTFSTLAEWDSLLEDADRAIRVSVRRRARG